MKSYTEDKPSKHSIYLDADNLYGWAMTQYLPTGGFKWLTQDEIKNLDVNTIRIDNPDDYIVEVDFDYPKMITQ